MRKAKTVGIATDWHNSHRSSANASSTSGSTAVLNIETSAQMLKAMTVSMAGFLPYLLAMELRKL